MLDTDEVHLEIRDLLNNSITTRIFLNTDNVIYPLGLLPNATVQITSLKRCESKNKYLYFRSTVASNITVLHLGLNSCDSQNCDR